MSLAPGTRLSSYEILGSLGSGGMGEVYRARDPRLQRHVALKVLDPRLAESPEFLSRFEREARAASALNHPNIVTIYDIGTEGGHSFIAQELVEGETLRDLIARGPVPLKKLLSIAVPCAEGLLAAHEKGIVHRDFKPENVIVGPDGTVKILDFGLAKVPARRPRSSADPERTDKLQLPAQELTQPGLVVGTPEYMSPEQAMAETTDFRSDQFAFGSVLYELLTGRKPFRRRTPAETLLAILRDDPDPIDARGSGETADPPVQAPVVLKWILARCLSKEPGDRYSSTRDLVRDLRSLRDDLPSFTAAGAGRSGAGAEAAPPGRLRRRLVAVLPLLALLAGFGAAWLLKPPPAGEPPALRYLTFSGRDRSPSVAPDGQVLVFCSERDGLPRIWLKQLRTGNEVALTKGPDDLPRVSPLGDLFLFVRDEAGRPSLFRAPLVGGEARKVLGDAAEGDFSPDGARIVFTRHESDNNGLLRSTLAVATADGADVRVLSRIENRRFVGPRFSPDGKTIAVGEFVGVTLAQDSIVLVDVATGKKRALPVPAPRGPLSPPAWLGDGESLVHGVARGVSLSAGAALRIVEHRLSGGAPRTVLSVPLPGSGLAVGGPGQLVFDVSSKRQSLREAPLLPSAARRDRFLMKGNSIDRQPAYSPDGGTVLFSSNRSGNLDLWSVDVVSGATSRITDDADDDWDPAFSADGKQVLWSSMRGGNLEIWAARTDGSSPVQVTRDGVDAENPSPSPDGVHVVYASFNQRKRGIWRVRLDGTEARLLGEGSLELPEVSPDGQYVSCVDTSAPDKKVIRVLRFADGEKLPFEILVQREKSPHAAFLGRTRWMPGGKAIAFLGLDGEGHAGVFVQDFTPGADTTASRRPLSGFDGASPVESFGISADGAYLTTSLADEFTSLMIAENVPGIVPPRREKEGRR